MVKNTARKLRIYPDDKQKQFFEKKLQLPQESIQYFARAVRRTFALKTDVSANELVKAVKPLKDEFAYLKEADSMSVQNAARDLHKSYSNHLSNPSHFGFPKFKAKRKARKSYRSNAVKDNIRIYTENKTIRLPKAGEVCYAQYCLTQVCTF